jgi:5-methylcytosine-specific restriction endonuclease McrA
MNARYRRYISSERWLARREEALADAGWCCEFCGQTRRPLHAHHLHYDSFGAETWADLIVLCKSCHADAHEYPKIREDIARFAASRPGARTGVDRDLVEAYL